MAEAQGLIPAAVEAAVGVVRVVSFSPSQQKLQVEAAMTILCHLALRA